MKYPHQLFGVVLLAIHPLVFNSAFAQGSEQYQNLKSQAEQLVDEGSFARANELYSQIQLTNLPSADQRWVQFRLADTQWRSEASTQRADTTKLDKAHETLENLIRDIQREEEQDRVWVEIQESLGDFWWTRANMHNWGQAWPHYQQALDWWAGRSDLDRARNRYLQIIWKMATPPSQQRYYSYGYYGSSIPLQVLENAVAIAQTEGDLARAHYLVAMTLRQQGSQEQRARIPAEFEAAIKPGRKTDWYDDALYQYADWMAGQGQVIPLENGGWRTEPDYVKALELFRRLMREFEKGETRYWDQAQNQIKNITEAQLGVSVTHIFLPDSEIEYHLNWHNVKRIDLTLYAVDLTRDVNLSERNDDQHLDWLQTIDLAGREKIKTWSKETDEKGDYKPGSESARYDGELKPGAYVMEALGGGKSARELLLVTDAALVLKTSGRQALVYFCNARDSSPMREGKVKLWERWHDGRNWQARSSELEVNSDGIAVFELENRPDRNMEIFASAISGDRQAFATGYSSRPGGNEDAWRIYAFTDRPAYRPGEKVEWKLIARRYNGSVYSTPSGEEIEFEITDARGAKVAEDKVSLNAFASAWGSLDVTDKMPLGEYRITFWDSGRKNRIGDATLFRLEEYKLPEFKVSVQTPEQDGKKKTFRLGETVEASIQADYYFGGPVANADVEVIVRQNPFWISWPQPREFPWYYGDMELNRAPWGRSYGSGQIIKRETLKTDATGHATLSFETPASSNQDFEYQIEARVTDSSRREIVGNGTVRVTGQRYYVNVRADHNLYKPQDKVRVEFKAQDANQQPVQVEGRVTVARDYWYEIWLRPDGTEVKGDELKRLQAQHKIWPPSPERPDQKGWQLKFRGYEHDDVLATVVKTGSEGDGELTFTPEREGYYRVQWLSEDTIPNLPSTITKSIRAETTVWVADNESTDIGYRQGGVEIVVDKDTFRVGQRAPVMISAPTSDRYVLFTVEGEELQSYQLVHLTGNVKLVELDIAEEHVPNIFLSAALVQDRQFLADTKQVVVPPTKNFLTVDVQPDREQYQPRDEGTLTVSTKDDSGEPVSAEVALSLVDESVFYIQSDYAGDPRQFFYGSKRAQQVQTSGTMNWKSYARLVKWEGDKLIEEGELERRRRQAGFGGGGGAFEPLGGQFKDETLALGDRTDLYYARGRETANRAWAQSAPGVATKSLARPASEVVAGITGELPAPQQAGVPDTPVMVRSDFRSTVLWLPDVKTGEDGKATIKVTYPDSLTSWKATARAVTAVNQFGIDETTTRTKQPLIVRLQAPRFFVVGDTVTISAVVNNNTDRELKVGCSLNLNGAKELTVRNDSADKTGVYGSSVNVSSNGEARVDWQVLVKEAGNPTIKVSAIADKLSDAMEKTYPVFEHGIEKFVSKSGKVRGDDITVKLDLPKERKADSTALTVQVTPSLAVTMLDALPYLINYPYGCTEQTMSRFLPSVIVAKTLRDVGLDPEDVMGRVFGGIEQRAAGMPAVLTNNPSGRAREAHSLDELDAMVKAGLDRLYDFQHNDGGWGWWKEGESDHWMTAYVVWGLALAKNAGISIKPDVLNGGVNYLAREIVEEEENPDMQAFMLHALGAYYAPYSDQLMSTSVSAAFDNLWKNRERLNAYTRALLALSAHYFHFDDKAKVLVENLENGVIRDARPDTSVLVNGRPENAGVMGTAHWGEDGIYWRWSEGGVEATAFALRALLAIDPENKLIEPVANWLIKNRRGAQWSNTRDTAIVVLAMNDYLKVSGELTPEVEYDLYVHGERVAEKKVSGADVFSAPSRYEIPMRLIKNNNEIRIRRRGEGPLYFAAEAKFFSQEEPVTAAGNEIFVKRQYYKLVGRPTLLKGFVYDKVPLRDGESVESGERVETVVTIEAKNNYEYLVFEDLKPAGFEAVQVRSGESLYARELKSGAVERKFGSVSVASSQSSLAGTDALEKTTDSDQTGRSRWVYQELRDRKVALFLDKLPEGVWELRYTMRAEVPGNFHALPVVGHAMYVPEIRCNGDEVRVEVADSKH